MKVQLRNFSKTQNQKVLINMGCCESTEEVDEPLVAQMQPSLCVNTNYITQSEMFFKMKVKLSMSGGDYVVRDQEGQDLLKVKTKAGLKPSTRVFAMDETLLVRSKPTSLFVGLGKHEIYGADDTVVATLKRGKHKFCSMRRKFIVRGMDDNELFQVEGGGCTRQFMVRNPAGDAVAKLRAAKMITTTLDLQVAQGMDAALITTILATVLILMQQER